MQSERLCIVPRWRAVDARPAGLEHHFKIWNCVAVITATLEGFSFLTMAD